MKQSAAAVRAKYHLTKECILTNDFVGVILTNKVLWPRIEKLDTLNEPLSQKMIKSFHVELKSRVFEDRANGYVFAFGMVS